MSFRWLLAVIFVFVSVLASSAAIAWGSRDANSRGYFRDRAALFANLTAVRHVWAIVASLCSARALKQRVRILAHYVNADATVHLCFQSVPGKRAWWRHGTFVEVLRRPIHTAGIGWQLSSMVAISQKEDAYTAVACREVVSVVPHGNVRLRCPDQEQVWCTAVAGGL
jgi:hypothetical protein